MNDIGLLYAEYNTTLCRLLYYSRQMTMLLETILYMFWRSVQNINTWKNSLFNYTLRKSSFVVFRAIKGGNISAALIGTRKIKNTNNETIKCEISTTEEEIFRVSSETKKKNFFLELIRTFSQVQRALYATHIIISYTVSSLYVVSS
jgi:hypothetical protein